MASTAYEAASQVWDMDSLRRKVAELTGDESFLIPGAVSSEELLTILRTYQVQAVPSAPGAEIDLIEWTDIRFGRTLSEGSYGVVSEGEIHGSRCAIKRIKRSGSRFKMAQKELLKEIEVMRRVRHPYVVSLLGIAKSPDGEIVLLMELMQGTLNSYRRRLAAAKVKLTWMQRYKIAREIALGLSWLHNRKPPILHLDLKFDNILHDEHFTMKVGDFGLSAFLPEEFILSKNRLPGNIGHMPPEILRCSDFNSKADVFSYGILLWEIMRLKEWEEEIHSHLTHYHIPMSSGSNLAEVVKRAIVENHFRPVIPDKWVPSLRRTLEKTWQADMTVRPSMSDLLAADLPAIGEELRTHVLKKYLGNDPKAIEVWAAQSKELETAPFFALMKALYRVTEIRFIFKKPEERHIDLDLLRLALGVSLSEVDPEVPLQRFGKLVEAFGPVDHGFIGRVKTFLLENWFHTEDEAADAAFFSGQAPGSWLVRFSRYRGCPFTISSLRTDGSVCHARVAKHADGTFSIFNTEARFPDFRALLASEAIQRDLQLLHVHGSAATGAPLNAAHRLLAGRHDGGYSHAPAYPR